MASVKRPETVMDQNPDWLKSPYGVILGKSYQNYRDSLIDVFAKGFMEADENMDVDTARARAREQLKDLEKKDKSIGERPIVSDSSVGGNDAINPYPSFGLDDDIVPIMNSKAGRAAGYGYSGMGRVYSEIFDGQQRILWMTFGVPHFNKLEDYLGKATAAKLAVTMENGYASAAYSIGHLLGEGLKIAFELPWYPIIWTSKLLSLGNTFEVTDYIKFYQSMPLYLRLVNVIASKLAVNMGIWGNTTSQGLQNPEIAAMYRHNLPEIIKDGPDIFRILNKRAARLDPDAKDQKLLNMSTDDLNDEQAKAMGKGIKRNEKTNKDEIDGGQESTIFDRFTGAFKGSALGGNDFIGFRIEKGTNASESFSNSTKETQLAQDLNGFVGQKRDISMNSAGGTGVIGTLDALVSGFKQFWEAASSGFKKAAMNIYTGNGYFDLPEVWAGSSFSKSYSFNMVLRAKYGDPVSIYQSIYIPLSCLLAGTLPRGTGNSTFTSPFMVRAYVKGMFAVPYGIIDSLSVERGDQEFGWNHTDMPTVVKVSFSIKDLSPVLYTHLCDGTIDNLNTTKLDMYLDTLAGIGLKERYFRWDTMMRRTQALLLMKRNTWGSSTYWATMMGMSAPIKSLMSIFPWHRVNKN